jgi:hypothetical protein
MAVFLEKQGFKPDAAADAAKNYRDSLALVPTDVEGYNGSEETETPPSSGTPPMQTQFAEPRAAPRMAPVETLNPAAPVRVVMNGNRLDIQASVDLEGLKKLKAMLEKYEGILEMMQPE